MGQPDLIRERATFPPTECGSCDNYSLNETARDLELETETETEVEILLSQTDLRRGSRGCSFCDITEYDWDSSGVVRHPQKTCIIL